MNRVIVLTKTALYRLDPGLSVNPKRCVQAQEIYCHLVCDLSCLLWLCLTPFKTPVFPRTLNLTDLTGISVSPHKDNVAVVHHTEEGRDLLVSVGGNTDAHCTL